MFDQAMGYNPNHPHHVATPPAKVVDKPWGREIWFADEDRYAGKMLMVRAGERLSLQLHERKKETLMVLTGQVSVQLGDSRFSALPFTRFTIEPRTVHRFTAEQDSILLEVSTPDLDDVVRLQDDYKRG